MFTFRAALGGILSASMFIGAGCTTVSQPNTPRISTSSLSVSSLNSPTSVILNYSKSDYEAALASHKLIVFYFYASWCPTCNEEFPVMQKAFQDLKTANVIGFRVHFGDKEATDDEKELAREFGIAYQHTKVLVKDGKRVVKSPESWDEKRYVDEITQLIK